MFYNTLLALLLIHLLRYLMKHTYATFLVRFYHDFYTLYSFPSAVIQYKYRHYIPKHLILTLFAKAHMYIVDYIHPFARRTRTHFSTNLEFYCPQHLIAFFSNLVSQVYHYQNTVHYDKSDRHYR